MTTNGPSRRRSGAAVLAVLAAGCAALLVGAAPAQALPPQAAHAGQPASVEWNEDWPWAPDEDLAWDEGQEDEWWSWSEQPCDEDGLVAGDVDENGNAYDDFGVVSNPPVFCSLPDEDFF
ncbi:MAG: hypothetical protein Q4E05_07500 [Pseudoclavibacter sp.]|nr:hypothetical protein [Pseudoclavibacter sp.]